MIGNRRELRVWGSRLAAAAFVLYCIYGGVQFRPSDAQDVLWLVFRAILAGGLFLGISWICLSAFAFLRQFLFEAPAKTIRERASSQRKHFTDIRHEEQQRERERLRLEQEAEERSRTLLALINECIEQGRPQQKKEFESLAELAAYFQTQRAELDQLPYDDEVKTSLLTNVNVQEEQAIRRFLSS